MNVQKYLSVTYDNYRCDFRSYSFYCNFCVFVKKSQIKKKDNRPKLPNLAVIF